ncbi:MAG: lipid II flippase MurJ [Planctomycetota bacterium]
MTIHQFTWSYVHWMVAARLGPTETGVYAGCLTIAFLSNPVILGLSNLLGARCSRSYSDGGEKQLTQAVTKSTRLYVATMATFVVGIILLGEPVLLVVFDNSNFENRGAILSILSLAIAFLAIAIPSANGLWAMQRPLDVCSASLSGLATVIATSFFCISSFGLVGAAVGLLLGSIVEATTTILYFHRAIAHKRR